MTRVLPLLLISACATAGKAGPSFDATRLAGTWHVVATNFPMWLEGKKKNPTFHYGVLGEGQLSDTVRYVENGEPGFIEGVDTLHGNVFTWRGTGLLVLFASEWEVAAMDPAGEWAVIAFSKTLATPEGVDVIVRAKGPVPEAARAAIAECPVLFEKAKGLTDL